RCTSAARTPGSFGAWGRAAGGARHRRPLALNSANPKTQFRRQESTMSLHIGSVAPDFEQDSTHGVIRFHDYLGSSWGVLFSHPKDFTPVCTTELGRAGSLDAEFAKRNVKMIAVSVDDVESHKRWVHDIADTQNCKVGYPILGDADRKVSKLYDMIHSEANDTLTVRSVFF